MSFTGDAISSKPALFVFCLSHQLLFPDFSHSDDGTRTLDPHWWRVNKPFPGVTDAMLGYSPKEGWPKGMRKKKSKSPGKIACRPVSIESARKGEEKAPWRYRSAAHYLSKHAWSSLVPIQFFLRIHAIFWCLPLLFILVFPL